jgi:hypothetical protein
VTLHCVPGPPNACKIALGCWNVQRSSTYEYSRLRLLSGKSVFFSSLHLTLSWFPSLSCLRGKGIPSPFPGPLALSVTGKMEGVNCASCLCPQLTLLQAFSLCAKAFCSVSIPEKLTPRPVAPLVRVLGILSPTARVPKGLSTWLVCSCCAVPLPLLPGTLLPTVTS